MDKTILAGRETSRIGFGCGRLAGGAAAGASIRLIEQARMLGITHFDVAPSYGLGLAEDVLGEALANDDSVTIATKVGIGRPTNARLKSLARQILRPVLSAYPQLRQRLANKAGAGARGQFAPSTVEESLAESLRRLRRDSVDVLLLHEPSPDSLTPELTSAMEGFMRDGSTLEVGSGTGDNRNTLIPFGTVLQYRWSPGAPVHTRGTDIIHGLLRQYQQPRNPGRALAAEMHALGFDSTNNAAWPGFLLTCGLASNPRSIVLVSSSDAARLSTAIAAIDWTAARGERPGFLEQASALLQQTEPS
jgi:hypothetical protein